MQRGKVSGSTAGRKRSSKSLNELKEDGKKPKISTISSWLSPVTRSKVARSTITPESKAVSSVKKQTSPSINHSLTQSYIDVGQRDFGKHVNCKKCGLLYTAGEEEDEREHEKFCKRMTRGIAFFKWKTERVLKTFPGTLGRILEIRNDDPMSHVRKLLEIKKDHQVVGCINVSRITKAYLLEKSASKPDISKEKAIALADDSALTASTILKPAVVGVCQLWVHPLFRRQSIASRMVDVAREKSVYGMHVSKNLVAFAQPTRNGLQFAQKRKFSSCRLPTTSPSGLWHSALFCADVVEQLLTTQFHTYMKKVQEADCKAELRRLVAKGPPIWLEDKHAMPLPEGDTHIIQVWFARDNVERSAKLDGAVEDKAHELLWAELRQLIDAMEEDKVEVR
ncbi:Protein involved in establishing cohesion between sister chromatids during DNA replication [Plasmopara halstedii]|uniref:Protein involved in establishing cohesion between sister chromatids during DNA replication n=1 Tax=Plasmopara halstedii TaxID=4781 RepID=A0A0P1ACD7_PLAHL|nr:Protein involved in establishing cohesion between sister chromatids during DNA replication [Plasmopara halstedii]CEG38157.1 Protein involved in establishing cohesion between sister chromatids during DNA replication [Plasmopara halstedii]|eukprot:XP_024574526.1 Protein involved in establishing cohesion between sister chromatids during DNA replication [Plasmopara halstedii]